MRVWILAIVIAIGIPAVAQRSEFYSSKAGSLMIKTTDSLVEELQKQGYTIIARVDTFAQCYQSYLCLGFLNNYLTDKVNGIFCLSSNYNGVRLYGRPSDRNKRFTAYRWNVTPYMMYGDEVAATCMSWDGVLEELFPDWNFFSWLHDGQKELLNVLFVSAPDKAKQNAYFAKLHKPVQTVFTPVPRIEYGVDLQKEREQRRKKEMASLSPEARKAYAVMDSVDKQYFSMEYGYSFWFDTLFKEGQTIEVDEQFSKMDEKIFFLVSRAPLDQIELRGTPFEAWSPPSTEIFKDITVRSKDYFIRRIHMIGSIKKISITNKGTEPIRIQVHNYNNSSGPFYFFSKEWFAELDYVKKQDELAKARQRKAANDAQIAAREKEIKAAGVTCYNCNGTGVEYIYSKCMMCGGDGQTMQIITGSKTVGQIKTFKGYTVSGNEIYKVRDNNMMTVEGKQMVTCSLCKGEGATKTGKTKVCHICDGNKKLYK